jgi:hypothetical protein
LHDFESSQSALKTQLEQQKAANVKLMKALKHMKKKLDASINSGVHHMLQDLQKKYRQLETAKEALEARLAATEITVRYIAM